MFLSLLFYRCLCAVSPSQLVIEGAARFLQLNHQLVTYLLRLRSHTLKGLGLTEAVLALMVLVAAASTEGSSKQAKYFAESIPSQQEEVTLWNTLGSRGDSFIADTCALLKLLGGEPLRSSSSTYGRGAGREDSGWWAQFPPSTAHELLLSEQFISSSQDSNAGSMNGQTGLVAPPGWSLFDQAKLMLSLRVTSLAAAFLRRHSSTLSSGSPSSFNASATGGHLAIDFNAVALAFMTCAGLSYREGASSSSSAQWLMNPSAIEHPSSSFVMIVMGEKDLDSRGQSIQDAIPALLYVAENLICVLHNLNSSASIQEKACWTLDLDRCVRVAERDFPSHSFIKQVGRWIRDQMNHENL